MGFVDLELADKLLSRIRLSRWTQTVGDLTKAATSLGFEIDDQRSADVVWAIHPKGQKFAIPRIPDLVRVGLTTEALRVLEEVFLEYSHS